MLLSTALLLTLLLSPVSSEAEASFTEDPFNTEEKFREKGKRNGANSCQNS